jgi:hypothetical protein
MAGEFQFLSTMLGETAVKKAAALTQTQLATMGDYTLNQTIVSLEAAKKAGVHGADQALKIFKAELARRKGNSPSNMKLYLLGGAGLAAVWFFFIRKK